MLNRILKRIPWRRMVWSALVEEEDVINVGGDEDEENNDERLELLAPADETFNHVLTYQCLDNGTGRWIDHDTRKRRGFGGEVGGRKMKGNKGRSGLLFPPTTSHVLSIGPQKILRWIKKLKYVLR